MYVPAGRKIIEIIILSTVRWRINYKGIFYPLKISILKTIRTIVAIIKYENTELKYTN